MPLFEFKSSIPVPASALYTYHAQPGAFDRLVPPWDRVQTEKAEGGIENDAVRILRIKQGPLTIRWVARHYGHVPGAAFCDEQEKGPFRQWQHEHLFLPESDGSMLHDRVKWSMPLDNWLGPLVQRQLLRMFRYRHLRTSSDLKRQWPYAHMEKGRFILCGRFGKMGREIAAFLSTAGHEVYRVRFQKKLARYVMEDPFSGAVGHPLEGADAVVYLGLSPKHGEDGQRDPLAFWDYLYRAIQTLGQPPKLLLNLCVQGTSLEGLTQEPAIDTPTRLETAKSREQAESAMEGLEEMIPRRVDLFLPTIMMGPFPRLVHELLHLETYLFLKDGARTPNFAWLSADDLGPAILHAVDRDHLQGQYAAMVPQRSTRADFQQHLLKRGFAAYTWHRMLRVLPWAKPGLPDGMRPELTRLTPLTETGFTPLSTELEDAFDLALGPR